MLEEESKYNQQLSIPSSRPSERDIFYIGYNQNGFFDHLEMGLPKKQFSPFLSVKKRIPVKWKYILKRYINHHNEF